jgi:hypothetical protein
LQTPYSTVVGVDIYDDVYAFRGRLEGEASDLLHAEGTPKAIEKAIAGLWEFLERGRRLVAGRRMLIAEDAQVPGNLVSDCHASRLQRTGGRSRRWLVYPRAKQVLDRLNFLVDHPRGTRMPSVAIYGDSGMDKTMIMKRFRDQHPPSFNSLTGRLKTPVLAMEMTSRPGERRFYAELLPLLGAPQRPRADIAQMEQAALRIMEAIGGQVLVIDEVHNILAGTSREQRIVLNTLHF